MTDMFDFNVNNKFLSKKSTDNNLLKTANSVGKLLVQWANCQFMKFIAH